MSKHLKLIFAFFLMCIFSSCATRGVPLEEQSLTFSDDEYIKIGSQNERDIYVEKGIHNIPSQEITAALNGTSQKYLVEKTNNSQSFLLKERNPAVDQNVIVIIGSKQSPKLVKSSLSQKNDSVLIRSSGVFYSKEVNKNQNTQYAH